MAGTTGKAAPAAAKVTVFAVDPIDHDGTRYEPGDALRVSEEQATGLIAAGAASADPAPQAEQAPAVVAAPEDPAQAPLA